MSAHVEIDEQSGEEKLEHARSMYLKTMSPTMVGDMLQFIIKF